MADEHDRRVIKLNSQGKPVLVPEGEDPDGPQASSDETLSIAFGDISPSEAEEELRYRELASQLGDFSFPDDNPKVAAILCKYTGLQPSEFATMDAEGRIPFVELAFAAIKPKDATQATSVQANLPKNTREERLTKALILLDAHPEWTNEKIADEVGVSPGTLSRWPAFRRAVEILADDGKRQLPRGWKTDDGVEATDD